MEDDHQEQRWALLNIGCCFFYNDLPDRLCRSVVIELGDCHGNGVDLLFDLFSLFLVVWIVHFDGIGVALILPFDQHLVFIAVNCVLEQAEVDRTHEVDLLQF